jgi:hypothetical protein
MWIPLSAEALVKSGAYELLGHFQVKTMETLAPRDEIALCGMFTRWRFFPLQGAFGFL